MWSKVQACGGRIYQVIYGWIALSNDSDLLMIKLEKCAHLSFLIAKLPCSEYHNGPATLTFCLSEMCFSMILFPHSSVILSLFSRTMYNSSEKSVKAVLWCPIQGSLFGCVLFNLTGAMASMVALNLILKLSTKSSWGRWWCIIHTHTKSSLATSEVR
jgi:hypothetical protein